MIKLYVHCWNKRLTYPQSDKEKDSRTFVKQVLNDSVKKYAYHYRLENNRDEVLKVKFRLKNKLLIFDSLLKNFLKQKTWSIIFDIRDITDDTFSPSFDDFIENFIVGDLKKVFFLNWSIFYLSLLKNVQFF